MVGATAENGGHSSFLDDGPPLIADAARAMDRARRKLWLFRRTASQAGDLGHEIRCKPGDAPFDIAALMEDGQDNDADIDDVIDDELRLLDVVRCYGANEGCAASWSFNHITKRRCPVARMTSSDTTKPSVALDHETTIIAVVELSLKSWVIAAHVPGLDRRPVKRTDGRADGLKQVLATWRAQAERAGRRIDRVVVAFEAGRDGFWLARLLRRDGVGAYVIHPASIPVPRGRRAKTDRLDTEMLLRAVSAWLRGEPDACRMAAIPSAEEEDVRRPSRERTSLQVERTRLINRMRSLFALHGLVAINPNTPAARRKLDQLQTAEGKPLAANLRGELERLFDRLDLVKRQIKAIESARDVRIAAADRDETTLTGQALSMIAQLVTLTGIGATTASVLVSEVFVRKFGDRRALARFVGLTGTPDESGSRRRDRGLMRAGSARVRHVMIQLAWLMLRHQPDCALVRWYRERVEKANGAGKKTFIVALARKLLIALWRFLSEGIVPEGMRFANA